MYSILFMTFNAIHAKIRLEKKLLETFFLE